MAATAVMQSSLFQGFNSGKNENTRGAGTNSIVSHYFPLNSDIVVAHERTSVPVVVADLRRFAGQKFQTRNFVHCRF
jgi:hypothetical protein